MPADCKLVPASVKSPKNVEFPNVEISTNPIFPPLGAPPPLITHLVGEERALTSPPRPVCARSPKSVVFPVVAISNF